MKIDKRRIEQFIRERVEIDAMTDTQIARLLNIATTTASHWRNKFNIKPADKFKRKFREKYSKNGEDAIEKFHNMIREGATLKAIAEHLGFSREYARQVHNKLYKTSLGAAGRRGRH